MDIAGPVAGFCCGLLFFGGGGSLAVNYHRFAVTFARRAEQSARSVGLGQKRPPHPMDEHDRIVFARLMGALVALMGLVVMVMAVGSILGLVPMTDDSSL